MSDPVLAHAMEHKPALIEALKTLVACPSVGADPTMAQGMEKARNLIEARLDAIGFQNRQRLTPRRWQWPTGDLRRKDGRTAQADDS